MIELLAVLAILAVIAGLSFPLYARYKRNMRQMELDSKAQAIYVAAQNQLVKLRGAGNVDLFTPNAEDWRSTVENGGENLSTSDRTRIATESGKGIRGLPEEPYDRDIGPDDLADDNSIIITRCKPLAAVCSEHRENDQMAAYYVLEKDTADTLLWNGSWIIEYIPGDSSSVYAVFYSEEEGFLESCFDNPEAWRSTLNNADTGWRARENRMNMAGGPRVGYYGGESISSVSSITLEPRIYEPVNGEKLTVTFECVGPPSGSLEFVITLTDSYGMAGQSNHSRQIVCKTDSPAEKDGRENPEYLTRIGRMYRKTLVLDDLTRDEWRFNQAFGQGYAGDQLTPGTDIKIELTVRSTSNQVERRSAQPVYTNSLFAYDENHPFNPNAGEDGGTGNTVYIACGRHLQNLETLIRVPPRTDKAVLTQNISFQQDGSPDGWYATYCGSGPSTYSVPILAYGNQGITPPRVDKGYFNGQITSTDPDEREYEKAGEAKFRPVPLLPGFTFDGNGKTIRGLTVYGGTDCSGADYGAALFSGLDGTASDGSPDMITLKNVSLTGTWIEGEGYAAALAGSVTGGTVTIDNCRVYLNRADGDLRNRDREDIWIAGHNTGGLAGSVQGGAELHVRNSFAATVAEGRESGGNGGVCGGLVGECRGTVTLNHCFADSYLYGKTLGGLVGLVGKVKDDGTVSVEDGGTVSMEDCYTAGFLYPSDGGTAAGLANGPVDSARRCYTICALDEEESDTGKTYYTTARSIAGAEKVWYHTPLFAQGRAGVTIISRDNTSEISNEIGRNALLAGLQSDSGVNAFTLTNAATKPYNLDRVVRSSYTFPRLNDLSGQDSQNENYPSNLTSFEHYGDWKAPFQIGGLVYYEQYRENGLDYYGFSGANAGYSLKDTGYIVGDGYGVVYRDSDVDAGELPETLKITIDGVEREIENFENREFYPAFDADSVRYRIYPLTRDLMNLNLSETKLAQSKSFFQVVQIEALDEDGNRMADGNGTYYFNPYFADTVRSVTGDAPNTEYINPEEYPEPPEEIYIRSSRHLYNLSRYYSDYYTQIGADKLENCTFKQERSIDYYQYNWGQFYKPQSEAESAGEFVRYTSNGYRIAAQGPIGKDSAHPFVADYDGGCWTIGNLSIIGTDEHYIGLFGLNRGTLKNIVMETDYVKDGLNNYFVQRTEDIGIGTPVYMGVLAGYNDGTGVISNCALSGYYVSGREKTIFASVNSTLYVGGLAGVNLGKIENCSAVFPEITVHASDATACVGGFVGENRGASTERRIQNCYSLGHIHVVGGSREVSVYLSGFAGRNQGIIQKSYAGVSLVAEGDSVMTYAFTPRDRGNTENIWYLDKGTYSFYGELRHYEYNQQDKDRTAGSARTYEELSASAMASRVDGGKTDTEHSSNAYREDAAAPFPFPAVVKDSAGIWVHYGDWQTLVHIGTMGVFYWEREEGGRNNAYYLTMVGTEGDTVKTATTLCTAHDDGGVISEYGYGVYVRKGEEDYAFIKEYAHLDWTAAGGGAGTDIRFSALSQYNADAKTALENSQKDYTFYPFTTRARDDASPDHIRLDPDDIAAKQGESQTKLNIRRAAVRNGSVTLAWKEGDGDYVNVREYAVSPFFANAIQLKPRDGETPDGSYVLMNTDNFSGHDYALEPGSGGETGSLGNYYEVRSVRQLQYINWNAVTKTTDQYVYQTYSDGTNESSVSRSWNQALEKGNRAEFPYLQYYNWSGTGGTAENRETTAYSGSRSRQFWLQTHDLNNKLNGVRVLNNFTPIAGAATSSPWNKGNTYLWAWFGGVYNGQSYKIQNLTIQSNCFTVGLFGVTVGAVIQNIILYGSDADAVIERNTSLGPDHWPNRWGSGGSAVSLDAPVSGEAGWQKKIHPSVGAYTIGGLIGTAYDYVVKAKSGDEESQNVISNCAIAGYRIIDRSTNRQGRGSGNVGGLIGVASVRLHQCSSVVDITVACTHDNGTSIYGNYSRVGGITGAAQYEVTDCYSGGSVTVSRNTIDEIYMDQNGTTPTAEWRALPRNEKSLARNNNTFVYVAGIAGSAYSCAYQNFYDAKDTLDANPVFNNCYSYLALPPMEGTIKGISYIAGHADRYSQNTTLTFNNCWYLKSANELPDPIVPDYVFADARTPLKTVSGRWDDETSTFYKVLSGDLRDNVYIVNVDTATVNSTKIEGTLPSGVSYQQLEGMSDTLNSSSTGSSTVWQNVTTTLGSGHSVVGVFSFPGGRADLDGQNYPFPTVITQRDLTVDQDVHVHYGAWTPNGIHWEAGRSSLNLFDKLNADYRVVETFTLADPKNELTANDDAITSPANLAENFHLNPAENAEILSAAVARNGSDGNTVTVTVLIRKEGPVRIAENLPRRVEGGGDVRPGGNGAFFTLRVSGNMNLSASPAKLYNYRGGQTALALYARDGYDPDGDGLGREHSADNSATARGVWDLPENDYITVSEAAVPPGGEGKRYTVKHDATFRDTLDAVFTYTYSHDGSTANATDYPTTIFLDTKTYGVLGLTSAFSGNEDNGVSLEAVRQGPDSGTVTGTAATSYTRQTAPAIPGGTEAEFCLYETLGDEALSAAVIDTVKLSYERDGTPHTVTFHNVTADAQTWTEDSGDTFTLRAGGPDDMVQDTRFAYRPVALRYSYTGTAAPAPDPPTVRVEVQVRDTVEIYDGTWSGERETRYSFTLDSLTLWRHTTSFLPGGGTGTMAPQYSQTGVFAMPPCEFTRTGYTFAGWLLADGTDDTLYRAPDPANPGGTLHDTYTAEGETSRLVFVAQWKNNTYTVRYNPNHDGAEAVQHDEAFTYGVPHSIWTAAHLRTLSDAFTRPEYTFSHWTLEGQRIEDGAEVSDLTAVDGGTVVLTARWIHGCELTLDMNMGLAEGQASDMGLAEGQAWPDGWPEGKAVFHIVPGKTTDLTEPEPYRKPARTGVLLEGWFTERKDGVQILNADGKRVNVVNGYTDASTFTMSKPQTLYAHWREAFVTLCGFDGPETKSEEEFTAWQTAQAEESNQPRWNNSQYFTLDGWYARSDLGYVKVLNADGTPSVATDGLESVYAEPYVIDGELQSGTTLYARWTGSYYLPVDRMPDNPQMGDDTLDQADKNSKGSTADGQYVILSGVVDETQPGNQKAMAVVNGSLSSRNMTVQIREGDPFGLGRSNYSYVDAAYVDREKADCVWDVWFSGRVTAGKKNNGQPYEEGNDGSGVTGYPCYGYFFQNRASAKYLYRKPSLELKLGDTVPVDENGYSNNNNYDWVYGKFSDESFFDAGYKDVSGAHQSLECRLNAVENHAREIYWYKGSFRITGAYPQAADGNPYGERNIYLYKLHDFTFYGAGDDGIRVCLDNGKPITWTIPGVTEP